MQHLCRICLQDNGASEEKSVQLFQAFVCGVALGTVIAELFGIEISEKDELLPQRICNPCFLELQAVLAFQEKLQKSDATLRAACQGNEGELLLEETVGSAATTSSSELLDHEYTTIEIISCKRCSVCKNITNDSLRTKGYHQHEEDVQLDVKGNAIKEKLCTSCCERLDLKECTSISSEADVTEQCLFSQCTVQESPLPQEPTTTDDRNVERFCCVTHCKEVFNHESELMKHVQAVHAVKIRWNQERQDPANPYECNICFRAFNSPKNLRIHQFVRTNQRTKQYACQECTFRAASHALLTIHSRSHSGERPYGCQLCSKRFYSELNLKNHQICHQAERPFECSQCSKRFARKRNMEEHIRSCHSDEKPFQCDLCTARFKFPQHLRLHRRLHTGEKPYQCSYCPNNFYHISDRKRHEMSHTGEKPYSCDICGFSYSRKRTLTIHERTHTGERPFGCDRCGKTFNQSSLLKRHMDRHHGFERSPEVSDSCLYQEVEVKNEANGQEQFSIENSSVMTIMQTLDHV